MHNCTSHKTLAKLKKIFSRNSTGMAPEAVQATSRTTTKPTSFSSDFLDETDFISINPHSRNEEKEPEKEEVMKERVLTARGAAEFEFLSSNIVSGGHATLTADELFFEGKLLPFWQMQQQPEKLNKIRLGAKDAMEDEDEDEKVVNKEESRVNWFVDDDPSPRPPKCTVLWKELLRLKKQRASSSSSSSSSSSTSLPDIKLRNGGKEGSKHVKRIKIRKGP